MTFNELNERVNTVSKSCSYVMNSRQPDEYTISQFEIVSLRVDKEDGSKMYYDIHKHRLVALGIPTNAGYVGYINGIKPSAGMWGRSISKTKLYKDNAAFERALKRIAKMNPTLIK